MATNEDDPNRPRDQQDERNERERKSVLEDRTKQKRPVEDKTEGAGPGVSSGRP